LRWPSKWSGGEVAALSPISFSSGSGALKFLNCAEKHVERRLSVPLSCVFSGTAPHRVREDTPLARLGGINMRKIITVAALIMAFAVSASAQNVRVFVKAFEPSAGEFRSAGQNPKDLEASVNDIRKNIASGVTLVQSAEAADVVIEVNFRGKAPSGSSERVPNLLSGSHVSEIEVPTLRATLIVGGHREELVAQTGVDPTDQIAGVWGGLARSISNQTKRFIQMNRAQILSEAEKLRK
jgi:hypothetical protein